jgi:hypothetical protein
MAESTRYARFALTFQSPWNIASETTHEWHHSFSVSGTIVMDPGDAGNTALDLAAPTLSLVSPKTSLIGWSYYQAGSTVSDAGGSWLPGEQAGQQNAYAVGAQAPQQLEVCILARCLVGRNTRGKNVYLRKWIHDVLAQEADPNSMLGLTNQAVTFNKWNNGAGPHDVVPVDPTGGAQGDGWTAEVHLYTHQLRRGAQRKSASGGSSLLSDLSTFVQDAAAIAKLAELAGSSGAG